MGSGGWGAGGPHDWTLSLLWPAPPPQWQGLTQGEEQVVGGGYQAEDEVVDQQGQGDELTQLGPPQAVGHPQDGQGQDGVEGYLGQVPDGQAPKPALVQGEAGQNVTFHQRPAAEAQGIEGA